MLEKGKTGQFMPRKEIDFAISQSQSVSCSQV